MSVTSFRSVEAWAAAVLRAGCPIACLALEPVRVGNMHELHLVASSNPLGNLSDVFIWRCRLLRCEASGPFDEDGAHRRPVMRAALERWRLKGLLEAWGFTVWLGQIVPVPDGSRIAKGQKQSLRRADPLRPPRPDGGIGDVGLCDDPGVVGRIGGPVADEVRA